LTQIAVSAERRLGTGIQELDRVLGGGFFEGSVTLFAGEPGIGKSTLLLQAAQALAQKGVVLYVSAEESLAQIQARAKRLKIESDRLIVISENNLLTILSFMKEAKPSLLILDSIQAVYHPEISQGAGSLSQVRDSAMILEQAARELQVALVLVGHVTKEGALAGPKTLEHLVDTVVNFEGDRYQNLRMLRAVKNRNGSTGEIGLFEMTSSGLEEVKNPSELFMGLLSADSSQESFPGRTLVPLMEGERPLVVEIQALATPTAYTNPVRRFTGIEAGRAALLVAVIEKTLNLSLSKSDLFLKVAGGLSVEEPACDLGVALAIVSSFLSQKFPTGIALIGELGLGGEVRPVKALEARVRECARLGIPSLILPHQKLREFPPSIKICKARSLAEAYQFLVQAP
jgi:DNA repair protein RadA/Sms